MPLSRQIATCCPDFWRRHNLDRQNSGQILFIILATVMTQRVRMLQRQRDGFAEVLGPMRGAGTFPAHEPRIAHDFDELPGLLENLMPAPFAEGFCHSVPKNISRAA